MSDEPIDFEKARNKRLPRMRFVELPDCDQHPNMFLVQLFENDGTPIPDRVGVHFEIDDAPAVALNVKQCRALARALDCVIEDLEGQARDGRG